MSFFAAEKVISIEKKLLERRRGECVTFQGLHFFKVNGTVTWTRETKPLPQSDPRFVISNEGKTLEIRQLQESDTALYSSMIQTEGGLEITRHWLVVRGKETFKSYRALHRSPLDVTCLFKKILEISFSYLRCIPEAF